MHGFEELLLVVHLLVHDWWSWETFLLISGDDILEIGVLSWRSHARSVELGLSLCTQRHFNLSLTTSRDEVRCIDVEILRLLLKWGRCLQLLWRHLWRRRLRFQSVEWDICSSPWEWCLFHSSHEVLLIIQVSQIRHIVVWWKVDNSSLRKCLEPLW